MLMDMKVSVVVAVHNGSPWLAQSLRAVFRSTYSQLEVIVVDDASTDHSLEIARSFPCQVIALPARCGPGKARNVGVSQATGQIIFFTDADVVIKDDVIDRAVDYLTANPSVAGVIGAYTLETPAQDFFTVYKNLQHHFVHRRNAGQVAGFFTACGAVRRSVFEQCGGFDEFARDCALEDLELGLRLFNSGYAIVLLPELQGTHLKRYTLFRLIYIEIWQRAVPYTVHLLRHRLFPDELSTGKAQRLSIILLYLILLLGALSLWVSEPAPYVAASLAGLTAYVWLNRHFYQFIYGQRGLPFTAGAFTLQSLSYAYCAPGFLIGVCCYLNRSVTGFASQRREARS